MFESLSTVGTDIGSQVNSQYLIDEAELMPGLIERAQTTVEIQRRVEATAAELVDVMRRDRATRSGIDAFLLEYDLSSQEGVALMCLAEALLRVPDPETADLLIADRLAAGDWREHLGDSESLFVNASTWGLMLTGRLVGLEESAIDNPVDFLRNLMARLGEPVVRSAMRQAMRIMAQQFVMGRDIGSATCGVAAVGALASGVSGKFPSV